MLNTSLKFSNGYAVQNVMVRIEIHYIYSRIDKDLDIFDSEY